VYGIWLGGLARKWVAGKELSMSIMSPSRGGRLLGQRAAVQRRRGLIDGEGTCAVWRETLRLRALGEGFTGV
jgi:hypothetical protein